MGVCLFLFTYLQVHIRAPSRAWWSPPRRGSFARNRSLGPDRWRTKLPWTSQLPVVFCLSRTQPRRNVDLPRQPQELFQRRLIVWTFPVQLSLRSIVVTRRLQPKHLMLVHRPSRAVRWLNARLRFSFPRIQDSHVSCKSWKWKINSGLYKSWNWLLVLKKSWFFISVVQNN